MKDITIKAQKPLTGKPLIGKPLIGKPLIGQPLTVGVWNCTFYLTDDDGNEILNNDGTVKMFDVPNMDWSYVAEHIELDDLKEIDND